ncbi:MAG: methyltransferase domain-containing protein [Candidatus Omnitrophica bacterium]|nr:methyltransferase domain-containing protein [Candidatus Omnitrophota bacterium]
MRERLFDDYLADTGHSLPQKRNLEGFEMMFLRLMPSDKKARILDIGCGCGQFLYMLRENGYRNIKGIDIGHLQVETTKKLGIDAEKINDLRHYLASSKGWDVIVMSQVIEHFRKDELYPNLLAIKEALADAGRVIIATPNMALVSGPFQRYIDFTHEIGFTERSLHEVLRVTGFRDIAVAGDTLSWAWRPKYLAWWLLRTLWFKTLGFIYLLERGSERPKIVSRHLIAAAFR